MKFSNMGYHYLLRKSSIVYQWAVSNYESLDSPKSFKLLTKEIIFFMTHFKN